MGTRSGDLDPAVVECIANNEHLTPSETLNVLNKRERPAQAFPGVSSDMRDVRSAAAEGNAMAKVTLDIWAYRIRKYIGAYAAAMGGLDAIIFTAGIGENDGEGRADVLKGLEFLGIKLDAEKNAKVRGVEAEILRAGQQGQGLGHPHQRGVGHRPRHADAHQQVNRFLRRFGGERRLFFHGHAHTCRGKKRAARFPLFPLPFLPARPILRRPAKWRGVRALKRLQPQKKTAPPCMERKAGRSICLGRRSARYGV